MKNKSPKRRAAPAAKVLTSLQVLSRNARVLRLIRGYSQEELGTMAGMTRTQISNLERGKVGIQFDTLDRLAKALGVAGWELLRPRDEFGRAPDSPLIPPPANEQQSKY